MLFVLFIIFLFFIFAGYIKTCIFNQKFFSLGMLVYILIVLSILISLPIYIHLSNTNYNNNLSSTELRVIKLCDLSKYCSLSQYEDYIDAVIKERRGKPRDDVFFNDTELYLKKIIDLDIINKSNNRDKRIFYSLGDMYYNAIGKPLYSGTFNVINDDTTVTLDINKPNNEKFIVTHEMIFLLKQCNKNELANSLEPYTTISYDMNKDITDIISICNKK